MISESRLKDAELLVRITMILILLTAGTSKLFSEGGFFEYYSQLFQGDLRINLSPLLVNFYLTIIPFIEILIGLALLSNKNKIYAVYGWFIFMLTLLFGHYILQEWSAVNQMLNYVFLGLLCLILPNHARWFGRDVLS